MLGCIQNLRVPVFNMHGDKVHGAGLAVWPDSCNEHRNKPTAIRVAANMAALNRVLGIASQDILLATIFSDPCR